MGLLTPKGDQGFTLSGFLILAALGTFLWKGAPLESARPDNTIGTVYETELGYKVPARLWQDPLKAAYSQGKPFEAGRQIIVETEKENQKAAVEANILMVMISPGSYAELEERRRRRRYAVVTGLGEENFVPRDPEALNIYYHSNEGYSGTDCIKEGKDSKRFFVEKVCYPIPYEWYEYENPGSGKNGQRTTLVLWLDESKFAENPISRIKLLIEELLPPKEESTHINFKATLIGPARSDALKNLVQKYDKKSYKWIFSRGFQQFNILSATATVDDDYLFDNDEKTIDQSRGECDEKSERKKQPLTELQKKIYKDYKIEEEPNLNFLRTIQSDENVISELVDELTCIRKIKEKNEYTVILSELDTYFARSLRRTFIKLFCKNNCTDANGNSTILTYQYQRGIDGLVVDQQTEKEGSDNSDKLENFGQVPPKKSAKMRRPAGTGQYDYLRRLATKIRLKDRELRLENGRGIRAVVLLGSDVYDKLLILRALRPELPGAIFATTDLDAQFLHPAEFSWTRNMIVATSYGLELPHQKFKSTTMPFRDSYQTSVYMATRMSVNSVIKDLKTFDHSQNKSGQKNKQAVQEELYRKIPPLMLEIGRQSLVPLLPNKVNDEDPWNRIGQDSFAFPIALAIAAMFLLGVFAFHQLCPKSGKVVGVLCLLFVLFVCLALYIFNNQNGGEPFSLLTGTSAWPAQYIRVFAVVLSFVFIYSLIRSLKDSWIELDERYFSGMRKSNINDSTTISELIRQFVRCFKNPLEAIKKIKIAYLPSIVMVIAIIIVIANIMPDSLSLIDKLKKLAFIWFILIAVWWLIIYGRIFKVINVKSINKWMLDSKWKGNGETKDKRKKEETREKEMTAKELWNEYREYGLSEHRIMRAIAYLLIYVSFASFLFVMLGMPESPCRGYACDLEKPIIGVSVISMLILLFLVFDAARLCICWVQSMQNKMSWEDTKIEDIKQNLRLPDEHAKVWVKVHLIGERTAKVTRLIYYPVTIILLMLLARTTYFDKWDFPQALAIVVFLNFAIALGCIVRLNMVAKSVRYDILQKLQEEKLAGDKPKQMSYEATATERTELIQQLENLRIGAYLNVWEQPPVRATLMLLGGIALTFSEYLVVMAY